MSPVLGNLEETILLLVVVLGDQEAYAVSVAEAHRDQMGKSISIPAVHTVLSRLEEKGLVKSVLGEASPVRGGKRKRIYHITKLGHRVLSELRASRIKLWDQVPAFKLT